MYCTMSRCWSVYRCGRDRLARYSRNLASGLCDTITAGNCTAHPPLPDPTGREGGVDPPPAHLSRMIPENHYRGAPGFAQTTREGGTPALGSAPKGWRPALDPGQRTLTIPSGVATAGPGPIPI